MSKEPRKPQSFTFDEPQPAQPEVRMRKPGAFDAGITLTPDELDPFLREVDTLPPPPAPRHRGLPLLQIFLTALGAIISVAFGLWLDSLIRSLFSRADWLGYAAIGVTGLVLTKLDGTAKGGVILGITDELKIPVRYVGLGERADDLREFNADEFVEALFGESAEETAAA